MRLVKLILVILILLLIGGANALQPDQVFISTDTPWLVAGGTATATINVRVVNHSYPNSPVEGAKITVSVGNTQIGTILSPLSKTNDNLTQNVSFTFKPGTKSGSTPIFVTATNEGKSVYNSTIQNVDHATPKKWSLLSYPYEGTVTHPVTITVRLADAYNNIIDNRSTTDPVVFRAAEGTDGGFWNGSGYVSTYSANITADGNATAWYFLPSIAGGNIIQVTAPATVNPTTQWIVIRGIADEPAIITSQVEPAASEPGYVPRVFADNVSMFTITYTVRDALGNPVPATTIWRDALPGEHDRFVTNDEGMVITTYGPQNSVGTVVINASLEVNSGVFVKDTVEFVSQAPSMWELTASPTTLASRDVKPNITTDIMAKVMDGMGNPVPDIPVNFTLIDPTNSTVLINPPELVESTALTDNDGYATIQLRPGEFPKPGTSGYDQTATGTVTVQAEWSGKTKDILITYKNYPYVRVETSVSPQTVQINGMVNVTVKLVGDGWALQKKPINAVLATDRSGSMMYDNPDRMNVIMDAMQTFIGQMHFPQDRIGIVSFGQKGLAQAVSYTPSGGPQTGPGKDSTTSDDASYVSAHYKNNGRYTYADYATVDIGLSANPVNINSTITSLIPYSGTPMRYALYKAIQEIKTNGSTNSVRAIVLLSDGDYNWYGDPLARNPSLGRNWGAESFTDLDTDWYYFSGLSAADQNLSRYALDNNIQIYSIAFGSDLTTGGMQTLQQLAETTNGTYYTASSTNIADVYTDIAGKLNSQLASAQTQMYLSYKNLDVSYDNLTTQMPGHQVYSYQYISGASTYITSWNASANPIAGHIPSYPYVIDQTSQWAGNPPSLSFDVGNISIDQTWETIFTLKVLTPGSISLFGPESLITFQGTEGPDSLTLPGMTVSSIANLTPHIGSQALVDVKDLLVPNYEGPTNVTDMLTAQWTLNYTGNATVNQDLYYQFSKDNVIWTNDWIHVVTETTEMGPIDDKNYTGLIDVRNGNGYYLFRVTAKENIPVGAYDEERMTEPIQVTAPTGFIQIQ
jgi:hypothetical protein